MITGVAIKMKRYEDAIVALDRPARHGDVIKHLAAHGWISIEDPLRGEDEQGFVDDGGEFYTRKQAMAHARRCGQKLLERSDRKPTDLLFSEDVW